MKTLTLQGTQQQFEYLYNHIEIKDKDYKTIPQEVETRVYVIEENKSDFDMKQFDDETFMTLAEQDGRVYTLQGFQEAFNLEEINSAIDVIRFIRVPVS